MLSSIKIILLVACYGIMFSSEFSAEPTNIPASSSIVPASSPFVPASSPFDTASSPVVLSSPPYAYPSSYGKSSIIHKGQRGSDDIIMSDEHCYCTAYENYYMLPNLPCKELHDMIKATDFVSESIWPQIELLLISYGGSNWECTETGYLNITSRIDALCSDYSHSC